MNSAIKLTKKKIIPNASVILLINNSRPLSLRLLNKSELPPDIIWEALSALLLCNKTIVINSNDIINKNIFKCIPPFINII